MTRQFPRNVIIEIPQYYALFEEYFKGDLPVRADFDELIRQLVYAFMNYPFSHVMDYVGVSLPELHLMRDKRWVSDPASQNKLSLVTAEIATKLYSFFVKADVVDYDGTLPYTPRNIHKDIMLLDYVCG